MRFFEVQEPYYALLKAESEDVAVEKYAEQVGDWENGELKEVSRDYALAFTSRALSENRKPVPLKEVLHDFNNEDVVILLIDGDIL